MAKCTVDRISMDGIEFNAGGDGLSIEVTHVGYKVVKDWEEVRAVEGSVLNSKETRHCWDVTFFNAAGERVGRMDMSNDWEPVKDLEGLPSNWKASPQEAPKVQPFLRMNVPKQV